MSFRAIEKRLFFAPLPDLSVLTAFRAVFTSNEEIIGIQPPCCRELIFTLSDVLVSPAFDKKTNLFIITQSSTRDDNKFIATLERLNVKLLTRIEVDAELFEYCLTFTIYQKLAPFWNKTAPFLVRGRNFLQDNSKIPAIGFEVFVTDKICIAVEPFLIKSPPIQVEDFTIDFKSLWNFKRDSSAVLFAHSIEDSICYVLPSFRRAHIVSISHSVPTNTPFKDYCALKQHWKLSYGYRLPGEDCQLYFNVRFGGSNVFTYPEWCVRKNDVIRYLRCDQNEICTLFFQDLKQRMPTIFNKSFNFTSDSLFWQNELPTASSTNGSKSFLSKEPQFTKENQVKQFGCKTAPVCNVSYQGFQYPKEIHTPGPGSSGSNRTDPNVVATQTKQNSQQLSYCNNLLSKTNEKLDEMVTIHGTENNKKEKVVNSTKAENKSNEDTLDYVDYNKNNENIIDIPDSPCFDQIVPDDFLQPLKSSHTVHRLSSKERKSLNKIEQNTSFVLIDHEMFDDNRLVPEASQTTDKVRAHEAKSTKKMMHIPEKSQFVPENTQLLPENTQLDRCQILGSVVMPKVDQFVPSSDGISLREETNLESQTATQVTKATKLSNQGRIIPQFDKKRKKQVMNIQNHSQIFTEKCITSKEKFIPSFKKQASAVDRVIPVSSKTDVQKTNNLMHPNNVKNVDAKKIKKVPVNHEQYDKVTTSMVSFSTPAKKQKMTNSSTNTKNNENGHCSKGLVLAQEILSIANSQKGDIRPNLQNQTQDHENRSSEPNSQSQLQQVPDSTTNVKKPKPKPKVQEDINMEDTVKQGKLSKVNAPTLKHWMKSKSIPFKASEKKESLILKIQDYLGMGN